MQKVKNININLCFKEAWRGFKGWWIPLCIVSTAIMLSQISIPKKLVRNELETLKPYQQAYTEFKAEVLNIEVIKHPTQVSESYVDFLFELMEITSRPEIKRELGHLLIKITVVVGVIVSILNLLMIILAKASVEPDKKKRTVKRNLSRGIILSFVYIFLAFVKIIPFFFCVLPGIYFYCKLFFTGFIITEESADPISAIAKSWKMTNGNFIEVLILFLTIIAVDIISIVTVIGVIPGTSYNYTLRAAAYRQLVVPGETTII